MFGTLEFATWLMGGWLRRSSNPQRRRVQANRLFAKLEEFVRRARRAGLMFFISVAALLAFSLTMHPIGLIQWLVALPLAGFGSLLSMLWPTRRFRKLQSRSPCLADILASRTAFLVRSRSEMPLASRGAFDLVARRLEAIELLAADGHDAFVVDEAERLIDQHLPRLVESFLALPAAERSKARADELADGLSAIAEELSDLSRRLIDSRTDRFDIQRRFIANRFPRSGLAAL